MFFFQKWNGRTASLNYGRPYVSRIQLFFCHVYHSVHLLLEFNNLRALIGGDRTCKMTNLPFALKITRKAATLSLTSPSGDRYSSPAPDRAPPGARVRRHPCRRRCSPAPGPATASTAPRGGGILRGGRWATGPVRGGRQAPDQAARIWDPVRADLSSTRRWPSPGRRCSPPSSE